MTTTNRRQSRFARVRAWARGVLQTLSAPAGAINPNDPQEPQEPTCVHCCEVCAPENFCHGCESYICESCGTHPHVIGRHDPDAHLDLEPEPPRRAA